MCIKVTSVAPVHINQYITSFTTFSYKQSIKRHSFLTFKLEFVHRCQVNARLDLRIQKLSSIAPVLIVVLLISHSRHMCELVGSLYVPWLHSSQSPFIARWEPAKQGAEQGQRKYSSFNG